ncbi:hypothetical protein AALC25_00165 [Lachnospiraceae bacterium 29-84]
MMKRYSELVNMESFEERYRYLKLDGTVGEETFGFDRYLNQIFYKSQEWKAVRDFVIVRDKGYDLGVEGYGIYGKVIIHHMNPISPKDVMARSSILLDPEYLICTAHTTHNAIHYGDESQLPNSSIERKPNDTCPWRCI